VSLLDPLLHIQSNVASTHSMVDALHRKQEGKLLWPHDFQSS
jgi:hypothetical protein